MKIRISEEMMMLRTAFLLIAAGWLSACGSGTHAPAGATPTGAAPIAGKPDVIISFDGANHTCIVALYSEPQGSTIPCTDLIPFLKDELRLPSGSIYDTRTIAKVDDAEMARTTRTLDDAGYRFIGGH
jgi:hypothetical protein